MQYNWSVPTLCITSTLCVYRSLVSTESQVYSSLVACTGRGWLHETKVYRCPLYRGTGVLCTEVQVFLVMRLKVRAIITPVMLHWRDV